MKIDFLKVWFPPINLWSRPKQLEDVMQEEQKPHITIEQHYWWRRGYQQALKDMKDQLERLTAKRDEEVKK